MFVCVRLRCGVYVAGRSDPGSFSRFARWLDDDDDDDVRIQHTNTHTHSSVVCVGVRCTESVMVLQSKDFLPCFHDRDYNNQPKQRGAKTAHERARGKGKGYAYGWRRFLG